METGFIWRYHDLLFSQLIDSNQLGPRGSLRSLSGGIKAKQAQWGRLLPSDEDEDEWVATTTYEKQRFFSYEAGTPASAQKDSG